MTEWLGDGLMCHQPGVRFFFDFWDPRTETFEIWSDGLDYWYLQKSPCGLFLVHPPNTSTYRRYC